MPYDCYTKLSYAFLMRWDLNPRKSCHFPLQGICRPPEHLPARGGGAGRRRKNASPLGCLPIFRILRLSLYDADGFQPFHRGDQILLALHDPLNVLVGKPALLRHVRLIFLSQDHGLGF